MKKENIFTYIVLIVLTVFTAFFSNFFSGLKIVSILILILSIFKFLLISFNFMELKKAHPFWKVLLITYLSVFTVIIIIII